MRIARTFQTPRIVGEASVLENVMIGGTIDGTGTFVESLLALPRHWRDEKMLRETAMLALSAVGLEQLAHVRADRLQHSELRFVEIARALMLRPAFLLLDEPAAGLSAEEIRRLGALVVAIGEDRHRRAAGGASRRPDLRHLPPRHRAQSRQDAGGRNAGRNPLAPGGGQCLSRRLSRCCDIAGLSTGYGKIGVLRGIDLTVERGRGGGAARAERRRQDHAVARGVRPAALVGQRAFRRPAILPARARAKPSRPGLVHVDRGASRVHPARPCSTICCWRPTTCRAASARRASRKRSAIFPEIAEKRHERADHAVRRPAADAGGGAGPGATAAAA